MKDFKKKYNFNRFPFSLGELPTSYKISMTYEEQLIWLCNFMEKDVIPFLNEVLEMVTNIQDVVDTLDQKIAEIDQAIASLDEFKTQIEQDVNNQLNIQYNRVVALMNDYQTIFAQQLNNLDNNLTQRIDDIELGDVLAYNPTTGSYENVSKVIMDIYETLRQNAISCAEYDGLDLTATEYDNKQITAYDFDTNGKIILMS